MTNIQLSRFGLMAVILLAAAGFAWNIMRWHSFTHTQPKNTLPFQYDFSVDGRMQEASNADESSSPYWWLSSGGYFTLWNGYGSTVQNELKNSDTWRKRYAFSNPGETDAGAHPQNIFRLLTKSTWSDVTQEALLRMNRYNISPDPHRSESNGVLLISRYQDQHTLYYGGLRVDGNAVIKKKLNGAYYTLALEKVFSGTYHRRSQPSLLPNGTWIGLKFETKNAGNGRVLLRLYADVGNTGTWTLVATADDDGSTHGTAITGIGRGGIRTDFMDVDIDTYRAEALGATSTADENTPAQRTRSVKL